jgi:hypothetical protein
VWPWRGAQVTGTSVYAYGVASVVTLATGANETEREFMRQKDELNMFMRQMHMPSELRSQLREYFMHYQVRTPHAATNAAPLALLLHSEDPVVCRAPFRLNRRR